MEDGILVQYHIEQLKTLGFEVLKLRNLADGTEINLLPSFNDDETPVVYQQMVDYLSKKETELQHSLNVPQQVWHYGMNATIDRHVAEAATKYMTLRMIGSKFVTVNSEAFGPVLVHVGTFSPDTFDVNTMFDQFYKHVDRLAYIETLKRAPRYVPG